MKYIVHAYSEKSELEKNVNWSLEKGYELVGGVSVTNASVHHRDLEYSQAMVNKRECP
jgi:hypothetical protein